MSTTIEPESEKHALGQRMKRKEDPRFLQGRGRYLDDISLPGMLYLALVHSPYPHAKIVKIDKTAALAVDGVVAVLTGEDLAAHGLAWIPTFHGYDKQMVLCVGKALYQYQEVAGVIATSREAAVDGAELVDVEYEPLDPVVDPFQAREDKTILRDDRENKTNHIYHWEVGKRAETDAALAAADVHVKERVTFQRCHPAPLEPCGIVADMNGATGRLTLYLTSQAPHAHRTVV
ncbi:MAG: molybdopterin-dependent oxidoreductase, partial [Candidatus Eremiobacteraeota bacterium]|nr:molybdopterin-dependent oxidoreductase [Candidatus Eremiobacteraeota bacterium]